MRKRPIRTLITEPLTRCGIVDEDWKYIVASTILTLVFSIIFVTSFWGMLLLTPGAFVTGILLSITLHRRRPPRWLHHQFWYLLRRLEALVFRRHPSIRSQLPGVESPLTARPRPRPKHTTTPAGAAAAPAQQARTRFDVLELLPASTPRPNEYKKELAY